MSEIIGQLIAYYFGIGTAAGYWYVSTSNLRRRTHWAERIAPAAVLAVTWIAWVPILYSRAVQDRREKNSDLSSGREGEASCEADSPRHQRGSDGTLGGDGRV